MKAILIDHYGDASNLFIGECDRPAAGAGELLVRIGATALNRADILQRQGKYPSPRGASEILGLEMAGTVEAVGSGCPGWKIGDRVFGLLTGGGYAQYVNIPARMAMPIPDHLSDEEAAAIPEVFFTAYQALHWIGQLSSDETVLVHAGASGIGTAAIQLINEAGAKAFITAGSARKLDFCMDLGAKLAINYRDGEFASHILEKTEDHGVQLVVDCVGAAYWNQNISCLATDGRMVLIATMGGARVPEANLQQLLRKRLQITGTTLRSRSIDYKIRLTHEFVTKVLPGFADGRFKPVIDSIYDWEEVQTAHERMENNENLGKIVLRVG